MQDQWSHSEYEEEVAFWRACSEEIAGHLVEAEARIKELEEGSCRFNCRTVKQAFLAGFDAGADDAFDGGKIIDDDFYKEVTEEAYKEWRGK